MLPMKTPCIIATLCEIKDGLTVEATTMKEYSFKPVIKSFLDKEVSSYLVHTFINHTYIHLLYII